MPLPITEADVRRVVGGQVNYERLCNETPAIGADSLAFTTWAPAAVARAEGILLVGWKDVAKVRALIESDEVVRLAIAMLCASLIGATKDDMRDEKGNHPYAQVGREGVKILEAKAKGLERSAAEQDEPAVGRHPRTRSGTVPKRPRRKLFSRSGNDPNDPGPGGF